MKKVLLYVIIFTIIVPLVPHNMIFAEQAEPIVKVKLINYLGNKSEITLKPNGDYLTSDQNIKLISGNSYLLKQENGKISLYKDGALLYSSNVLSANPVKPTSQLSINNRIYLGSFDFEVENNRYVRPINSVFMEDYLKGVVPIEMYPSWKVEALKTQAVAARTYAMSYSTRGVIDDTIAYQVYGGYNWTPNSTKAVDETKGQVAEYNGRLINAVYSASNGGRTENNANAWGTALVPYLPIKQDPYDPRTVWSFSLHKRQMDISSLDLAKSSEWWSTIKEADQTITSNIKMWLNANGYANNEIKITAIPEFSLYAAGSGGRVNKGSMTVEFIEKDNVDADGKLILKRLAIADVSASIVRSIIGNRVMWSYLVAEFKSDNDTFSVKGLGDGHGVGMSQWGAKNMADAGKTYDEILKFYYSGISIVNMYGPSSIAVQGSKRTGWVKDHGKWYFFNPNGSMATDWLKNASQWYYLNGNGEMQTGWKSIGGKWYYLKPTGAMATGWLKDKNKWYYLTSTGAMATGWIKDKGKTYYLSKNGEMVQNRQYIAGKWYQFHTSGYLIR
ncbi:SpoIID/LytB domain-containing protein [Neobacillus bataviensis]|uniref:SpoIID/LytB domain-containing protein n=1 Tax=Neobacillus bataviensis TaxID=220685 RepID=UPI001CBB96BB|nr:SpoIID/LytB domain-containing protein [Neobacillus bataviensis]